MKGIGGRRRQKRGAAFAQNEKNAKENAKSHTIQAAPLSVLKSGPFASFFRYTYTYLLLYHEYGRISSF